MSSDQEFLTEGDGVIGSPVRQPDAPADRAPDRQTGHQRDRWRALQICASAAAGC